MLILTRKLRQSIIIGEQQIRVLVGEIRGKHVKLAITAPRDVHVRREEITAGFERRGTGDSHEQGTLVLNRTLGESVIIGEAIRITATEIKGKQIKLAIDAPRDVIVCREEIYESFMRRHAVADRSCQ